MKNLQDVIFKAVNDNFDKKIRFIDVQSYYNFTEMLKLFTAILSDSFKSKQKPDDICIICVTYDNFRIARKLGYEAIYLYDFLDFTDEDYYLLKKLPVCNAYIMESASGISSRLMYRIHEEIPRCVLYVFHDSYILRRYTGEMDTDFIKNKSVSLELLHSNKSHHSNSIQSFLNKIRVKKNILNEIIEKTNVFGNRLEMIYCNEFKLSEIDISSVIITPHITIIKSLNILIREYLGIVDIDDECKPMINEWLISHGPSTALIKGKGEVTLPIGYRLRVKEVLTQPVEEINVYDVVFDYESPTGEICEAVVKVSKPYIEYLMTGKTNLVHASHSYNYYFGYVVGDFFFSENRVDNAIVIYDHTLSQDKRDLYSCLLPIVNDAKVYYNLSNRIKISRQ